MLAATSVCTHVGARACGINMDLLPTGVGDGGGRGIFGSNPLPFAGVGHVSHTERCTVQEGLCGSWFSPKLKTVGHFDPFWATGVHTPPF